MKNAIKSSVNQVRDEWRKVSGSHPIYYFIAEKYKDVVREEDVPGELEGLFPDHYFFEFHFHNSLYNEFIKDCDKWDLIAGMVMKKSSPAHALMFIRKDNDLDKKYGMCAHGNW